MPASVERCNPRFPRAFSALLLTPIGQVSVVDRDTRLSRVLSRVTSLSFRSDLVQINRPDLGSTLLTQEQEMFVLTPYLKTSQETQTPAVASSAPVLRDLTIPCGSSTNFFAAPLSKSR